ARIGEMRESQAYTAGVRKISAHADMVTKLERRAQLFIGKIGAGKNSRADTCLEIVALIPEPPEHRRGAELPGAGRSARAIGHPVCCGKFGHQIQTPIAA